MEKFTDQFIQLPTFVMNKNEVDMIGEENAYKESIVTRLRLEDISYYEPTTLDSDGDEMPYTMVMLKCSESMVVQLSVEEFEQRLNDFASKTK